MKTVVGGLMITTTGGLMITTIGGLTIGGLMITAAGIVPFISLILSYLAATLKIHIYL
jgi:hypothetical protein